MEKFSPLKTGSRFVIVVDQATDEDEEVLHAHLTKIKPAYTRDVTKKEHLRKVAKIEAWMKKHAVITPYSFDIMRCYDVSCCGEFYMPTDCRVLAVQRQPTPILDPRRKDHFYRRTDALTMFAGQAS